MDLQLFKTVGVQYRNDELTALIKIQQSLSLPGYFRFVTLIADSNHTAKPSFDFMKRLQRVTESKHNFPLAFYGLVDDKNKKATILLHYANAGKYYLGEQFFRRCWSCGLISLIKITTSNQIENCIALLKSSDDNTNIGDSKYFNQFIKTS